MPLIFQEQGYKVESEGSSVYVVTPDGKKESVGTPSAGREKIKEMLKASGEYGKRGYFGNADIKTAFYKGDEYIVVEQDKKRVTLKKGSTQLSVPLTSVRFANSSVKTVMYRGREFDVVVQRGSSIVIDDGVEQITVPVAQVLFNSLSYQNEGVKQISVTEMAKIAQNSNQLFTSEGQRIGSKDIKPGMIIKQGGTTYQVSNAFQNGVSKATQCINEKMSNASGHYHIEDYNGELYVEGPSGEDDTGPFSSSVEAKRELDKRNKEYQQKFGNAFKSHIDMNAWKIACQKEFDKRGLGGFIRYSGPNTAGDTFAYIGATSEYVGKWFGSNNYGEVLEK